ncbi:uncharacterized protein LOC101855968 [Aplysia californica]|uniref:Uncharacterized protein LOC101855968 n=1 Tax=Aplysia californica TaxID=6500 RepID=A0ABM1A705_APLCA|nr:uncharacterized protein LOC101855968 [Aplysia californica]
MVRVVKWVVCALFVAICNSEETGERSKRARTVWSLSSLPSSNHVSTILDHFKPIYHDWGDDSISTSTKHSSSRALRIFYKKGSYSKIHDQRGAGFYSRPSAISSNVDAMILKYDVYFENFGFGIGGKLPGLFGGENGDGAYLCSGGSNPSSCFSLRMMWRKDGDGELYAYIPSNQESGFKHRDDVITDSTYGQSLGRGKFRFMNNKWHSISEEVHLNTVGKTDGWVQICVKAEGHSQQCYKANNLRMRNTNSHHLRGMFFSTFFGGSSHDYAAPNDCYTYFKNFQISTPAHAVVG